MSGGMKTALIGVVIFLIGAVATAASNGRTLFWGAMAVGALNVLVGLFRMARGT